MWRGFPQPALQMGELTSSQRHSDAKMLLCLSYSQILQVQLIRVKFPVKMVNIWKTKTISRFRWKIIQITVLPWQWYGLFLLNLFPVDFLQSLDRRIISSYAYLHQDFSRKSEIISNMSKTSEWWPQLWTWYCGVGRMQLRTVASTSQGQNFMQVLPLEEFTFP